MNTVCHIEIDTTDLDRSQAFYETLFGWTFQEFMGGSMRVFGVGETHVGGLMKVDEVAAGRSPSVWIQVASVDEVLAVTASAGGSIIEPKGPTEGVGFSGILADPDGNRIGLVEFAK